MNTKKCCVCKQAKNLEEFGKCVSAKDGKNPRCKPCNSAKSTAYYKANKARCDATSAAWKQNNKGLVLERGRKARWQTNWVERLTTQTKSSARKRGLEFAITKEDVRALFDSQQGRCYWLNLQFEFELEPRHPLRPSIDRLDPSRGYTRDNIVLACMFANLGRSSLSAEKFADFLSASGLRKGESLAA